MFNSSLSLDQAPPLRIPLLFFITSPIFALLAGLFVLGFVPSLESQTSSGVMIFTYFIALGFLAMTMLGIMFQMLPVTAGVALKHQQIIAPLVHGLLSIGLLVFAYAFYAYQATLMIVAMVMLLSAFIVFVVATALTLKNAKSVTPTIKAFIGALASLTIALFLAGYLLLSHDNASFSEYHQTILYTYIIFSILGWVVMLIIGVSYQVIPMFYVAETYPDLYTKYAIKIIFALLVGLSFALFSGDTSLYLLFKIFVSLLLSDYAITTISLLFNRKRKVTDTSTYYWYFSMLMLLSAISISLASEWLHIAQLNTLAVLIFLYGFAMSTITGIVYKILPFLVWFHLNNKGYMNMPTMSELIGKKLTTVQFILHVFTLLSLIALVFDSNYQIIAGVIMALSNAVLLFNLIKGSRIYFTKQGLEKMNP
ncbi:hypothetical protein CRYPA_1609 [uncultured Candidatus Thioglobus sp.]|nr:hypothetical protein CRYPA_1609 [uncultured Candidatus Thioglobus sp.]